jgi:uncharacterized HAD superfamily protein
MIDKPKIILVDIDHTMSNSFWRDSMIGVHSWDEYHAASRNDKPFPKVIQLVNALYDEGYAIIAITGRTENFRSLTIDWLLDYKVEIDELLMRPIDCFIKNQELKVKLIEERFKKNYSNIHFFIDDNEEAILAFNKLGITTLQIRNVP